MVKIICAEKTVFLYNIHGSTKQSCDNFNLIKTVNENKHSQIGKILTQIERASKMKLNSTEQYLLQLLW